MVHHPTNVQPEIGDYMPDAKIEEVNKVADVA